MSRLLLVDDDPSLVRALSIGLAAHGYDVITAADGPSAVTRATHDAPDLILVDLGLPRLSGIGVIQAVRAWSRVPIIVLSARPQEAVKVAALDAGADDYLTKPFGLAELLARVRAALRRAVASDDAVVVAGPLSIDLAQRRVERRGELVQLTPKEWAVLGVLARQLGALVTQDELLSQAWGAGHEGEDETLRALIARLRKKLEDDPAHPARILTEHGHGYRLEP